MPSLILSWLSGRCGRVLGVIALAVPVVLITTAMWYAQNSDRDDIPPILTQLIPAGHATCQSSTTFECAACLGAVEQSANYTALDIGSWRFEYHRDGENEGLEESQCESAFPGLFEDIRLGVTYWNSWGTVTSSMLDTLEIQNGMTRAMIYDGHLYVIATKSKAEDHRRKTMAVLSSMHRALTAAQDRLSIPNIEFTFSVEDKATDVSGSRGQPLWVLARKASEESMFLFPDFGLWAWDNIIYEKNNEIGPYDEVVNKALGVEEDLLFAEKESQLVWRGKLSFAPKLRRALLDASRDHDWNNVKEIDWRVRANYLTMEEHCKYKFIAHVEGRSYSASLKYRQACRSVIVAHKLQYIQHHHYLLVSSGPMQNYVEVERDFSDLAVRMDDLLGNPGKAEMIADNSVRTFRERYLTPAAEACYWRALWRGYGSISVPAQLWKDTPSEVVKRERRGLRYETFILLSSQEMMDFQFA